MGWGAISAWATGAWAVGAWAGTAWAEGVVPPVVVSGGAGSLWAKGRGALKLGRKRPLTIAENEELKERLQAIAAAQALASIPMDSISDSDIVMGEEFDEDDDLILQAAILRILH